MEYGRILKQAWMTIWKHKVIIWFGFLMMISSLLMGLVVSGFFFFFNEDNFSFFFHPYASASDINPLFPILIVIVFLGFTIFSYVMMALSFAGVIKGTFDLEQRQHSISFGELWDSTFPYIGRVFGVFFLVFFAIFLFIGIFMLFGVLVGVVTAGIGVMCLMPLFLLILPLELVAYLFASLGMPSVVVENLGVFDALRRAWDMMKQKFWPLILMAIILVFIQWALGMIIMLPMQAVQFFTMFSTDMTNYAPDPGSFFRGFAILMAIFIPLASLAQGLGLTYANAAWTLTYMHLAQNPVHPETPVFVEPVNA